MALAIPYTRPFLALRPLVGFGQKKTTTVLGALRMIPANHPAQKPVVFTKDAGRHGRLGLRSGAATSGSKPGQFATGATDARKGRTTLPSGGTDRFGVPVPVLTYLRTSRLSRLRWTYGLSRWSRPRLRWLCASAARCPRVRGPPGGVRIRSPPLRRSSRTGDCRRRTSCAAPLRRWSPLWS